VPGTRRGGVSGSLAGRAEVAPRRSVLTFQAIVKND
jgi:hypothetical protein